MYVSERLGDHLPFFFSQALTVFCLLAIKLKAYLEKGKRLYMISILLLGVSTFCTDGWAIIGLNKLAVFLLVMCLLLNQYFDTKKWNLGNMWEASAIGGYELRGTGEAFFPMAKPIFVKKEK